MAKQTVLEVLVFRKSQLISAGWRTELLCRSVRRLYAPFGDSFIPKAIIAPAQLARVMLEIVVGVFENE